MSGNLIQELRDAADDEDKSVGVQQDFYHSELLRKAADALSSLDGGRPLNPELLISEEAKLISRKPSEQEVRDIRWQINRKQSADRVDAALVEDVWAAIVYLSRAVPELSVRYTASGEGEADVKSRTGEGTENADPLKLDVKALDETDNVGWTDGKGRFCLPLSAGYYVQFPGKDDPSPIYMAWFYTDMVGGSSDFRETKRLAQEHHKHRILSALKAERPTSEPDGELAKQLLECAELLDGESTGAGDPCRAAARLVGGRGGLFDGDAQMADGGDTPMTAAEEVLAWLIVEKVGVPDDVGYSPSQAQEIISARLDGANSEETK